MQPVLAAGILDVGELDADLAAVRRAQPLEDLTQGLQRTAGKIAGDVGPIEIVAAEAIMGRIELGEVERLPSERIRVGDAVAAGAIGMDQAQHARMLVGVLRLELSALGLHGQWRRRRRRGARSRRLGLFEELGPARVDRGGIDLVALADLLDEGGIHAEAGERVGDFALVVDGFGLEPGRRRHAFAALPAFEVRAAGCVRAIRGGQAFRGGPFAGLGLLVTCAWNASAHGRFMITPDRGAPHRGPPARCVLSAWILHALWPSPFTRILRPPRPRGGPRSRRRVPRAPARRRHTARRPDRRGGGLHRGRNRSGLALASRADPPQSLDVRTARPPLRLPQLRSAHVRERGVRSPRPGRRRAAARTRALRRNRAHARAARSRRAGAAACDRERAGTPRASVRDHARRRRALARARCARAAPAFRQRRAGAHLGEPARWVDARGRASVPLLRPAQRVRQPRPPGSARLFQAAKSAG